MPKKYCACPTWGLEGNGQLIIFWGMSFDYFYKIDLLLDRSSMYYYYCDCCIIKIYVIFQLFRSLARTKNHHEICERIKRFCIIFLVWISYTLSQINIKNLSFLTFLFLCMHTCTLFSWHMAWSTEMTFFVILFLKRRRVTCKRYCSLCVCAFLSLLAKCYMNFLSGGKERRKSCAKNRQMNQRKWSE